MRRHWRAMGVAIGPRGTGNFRQLEAPPPGVSTPLMSSLHSHLPFNPEFTDRVTCLETTKVQSHTAKLES